MTTPNQLHIATYQHEGNSLTAYGGPSRTDLLWASRLVVNQSGYNNGIPGYVRRGAMSNDEVIAYLTGKSVPSQAVGQGVPRWMQQIDLFRAKPDTSDELIASVRYGKSTTNTGVYGIGIAHTNEFTVKAEDLAGRKFSPAELGVFGFAIGHASLLHMTQQGFNKVTYNTEKSIYDGLRAELENLGVWPEVVELEKIPHFAVAVDNSHEMTRTEMGISIAVAQTALENTCPWLAQPQQQ